MQTYRSGHNGADSKKTRVCHWLDLANPLVIGLFATFDCTFENFFLAVFSHFSFVCFNNFIWRCIEEVITRTTRNRFVGDEPARGFESHRLRQKTTDSDRNLSFLTKCAYRRVKFASQVKLSCGQCCFCGSGWRT